MANCYYYRNSVAFYNPASEFTGCLKVVKISHVVDASSIIVPGYPMGSFLSPEKGGKPYSEMADDEKRKKDIEVFTGFLREFRSWLKS